MDPQDAKNRPEKRPASRRETLEPGILPIRSSPDSNRSWKASDSEGLGTILDFLNLPYQQLRDLPGIQP